MKKILPVIITLIGLSLIGLILLQASWLNNLVELRHAQVKSRIMDASTEVTESIKRDMYSNSSMLIPHRFKNFGLGSQMFRPLKPKMIADYFTLQQINEKIVKAFANEDLKKIKYDFAIEGGDAIEMQSEGFTKNYFDTVNNKKYITVMQADSGTDAEGLSDTEALIIIIPNFEKQILGSLTLIIISSIVFTIIIIAAFFITVKTLLNQKKISEIKSDFINNMTHEFKTPIATISLAVDAIRNQKVQNDPVKLQYFSGIIKEENKRMNRHVETILQAALLEKRELQFNNKKVNAHIIIAQVVDNYNLQLQEKEAVCYLNLNATDDVIEADELHFTNVISNLIDNAIKYSKENLVINISSVNQNNQLHISIADNGIGMSRETVKNVFEKFYRAHTGNVHNVKGFGLGMSYVKTILDAINGTVKVSSVLGKGSTFTLQVPLANQSNN